MTPKPETRKPESLLTLEPYGGFLGLFKSLNTKIGYQQDLKVLKQFLDSQELAPLTAQPQDLARFVGFLAKPGVTPSGKPRAAYGTRSIKRILAATRSFYRYLISARLLTHDPTAVFHTLAVRSPQRNPRPLPPAARQALLAHLRTEAPMDLKASLVVLLGFHCGLRVSEIAGLRYRDLDLSGRSMTVIGKGDKERILPLTDQLCSLLERHRKNQESSGRPSLYLFPSPRDREKPANPRYPEDWVKKAAHWAGLENAEELTVHVLRHTFGTQLAESGASVYEIRDLMGHSSIVVSENYVKLASNRARQAHRKAFGSGYRALALDLPAKDGVQTVLRRYRAAQRRV